MTEVNVREVLWEGTIRTLIGATIFGSVFGVIMLFMTFPTLFAVCAMGVACLLIGTLVRKLFP